MSLLRLGATTVAAPGGDRITQRVVRNAKPLGHGVRTADPRRTSVPPDERAGRPAARAVTRESPDRGPLPMRGAACCPARRAIGSALDARDPAVSAHTSLCISRAPCPAIDRCAVCEVRVRSLGGACVEPRAQGYSDSTSAAIHPMCASSSSGWDCGCGSPMLVTDVPNNQYRIEYKRSRPEGST
jgi:hypothetical protein